MNSLGPYLLEHELGRGAHAVVYRAFDPRAQRHVALKVLLAGDPRRLAREAQLTAALRHPGIVAIHDLGHAHGRGYIAYELVDGARDLRQAWANADLPQRVDWVLQAAHALGAAHAQGIVHRDVKPENLLVTHDGHVKVADFGVAWTRAQERLTQTGGVVGTPTHMAPEQWSGAAIGPAADVWALGVILYEALTDTLPFQGDSWTELADAVQRARPAPPRLPRDAPAHWARACLHALDPDPERRPPDGAAFAEEVERAATTSRPLRWLAAGALVVGVGGALVWRPPTTRAEPAPTPRLEEPVAEAPDRTEEQYREAMQIGNVARQPDEALAAFERALEFKPGDRMAWRGRVRAWIGLEAWERVDEGLQHFHDMGWRGSEEVEIEGRYAKARGNVVVALERFEEAVRLDSGNQSAHGFLVWLRRELGDLRGALEAANRMVEQAPGISASLNRAQVYLRLRRFQEVLDDLREIDNAPPRLAYDLWLTRGDALHGLRREGDACDAYERAIEIDASRSEAYTSRATARLVLGRKAEGVADLRAAAERMSDPSTSAVYEGVAFEEEGRYEEALGAYDRALRANPSNAEARFNRGLLRIRQGQFETALEDLQPALEAYPTRRGLARSIAQCLCALNRYPEAAEVLARAAPMFPDDVTLLDLYSRVLISLGRHREALEPTSQWVEHAAGNPVAWSMRAYCLLGLERYADALQAARSSLQLGRSWQGYQTFGRAALALGDPRSALTASEAAIQLTTPRADLILDRAHARRALGDHQGAHDDYASVLRSEFVDLPTLDGFVETGLALGDTDLRSSLEALLRRLPPDTDLTRCAHHWLDQLDSP